MIELLVVISIIAVLAGMLLPTLSMVKAAATNADCQSRLRQVYLAYGSYAEDWQGRLPRLWSGGVEQAQSGGNMFQAGPFDYISEQPCHQARAWRHFPKISICPLNARKILYNSELYPCYQQSTYSPNLVAWNAGSQWGRPRTSHFPQGLSTSALPLLVESAPDRSGSWDGVNDMSYNHRGKSNAVCFDGHVAAFAPTQRTSFMVDGTL